MVQVELKDSRRAQAEPAAEALSGRPAELGPDDIPWHDDAAGDEHPPAVASTDLGTPAATSAYPIVNAAPERPRSWWQAGAGVLVVTALLASLLLSRCGPGAGSGSAQSTPAKGKAASTTTLEDVVRERRLATEPVLRIQPQRALAPLTSPLTLDVRGEGCAGRSGVLSIVEVGSAPKFGDPDRLVVRRRIDVDSDGKWQLAPLLVGQPPGSYEILASCERRARSEGFPSPEDRRDVFTVTDVLELIGPLAAPGFTVTPELAEQDRLATLEVSGSGCRPNGSALSRVKGSLFGQADARRGDGSGYQASFEVDARPDGTWRSSLTVPAEWARGTYGIQVACDRLVFATQTVHFVAASQLAAPAAPAAAPAGVPAAVPAGGAGRGTAAQPVKAVPRFTG